MRRHPAFPLLLGLLAIGCESAGDELVEITAASVIEGIVFVDADADRDFDSGIDTPAMTLDVALVLAGTADTVARTRTNASGAFTFPLVPVGRYEVVIPASALADSMSVVWRDPPGVPIDQIGASDTTSVVIGVLDTAVVRIGISYPVYPVDEARVLPPGRRVLVRGVAQNSVGAVGDSSLFMQGGGLGLRATRIDGSTILPGDSVLLLGTTGTRDGQPVLADATPGPASGSARVDTVTALAAAASNAAGGVLDALLASVVDLLVTDTTRADGWFVISGTDASGLIEILVPVAGASSAYVPGAEIDVVGILVPDPDAAGSWQIRPRAAADIVVTAPTPEPAG